MQRKAFDRVTSRLVSQNNSLKGSVQQSPALNKSISAKIMNDMYGADDDARLKSMPKKGNAKDAG